MNSPFISQEKLASVKINGELFFKISDVQKMRPFFITVVSDSNHWMFFSSNGGMSAGRKNPDFALFPYCTDDKIIDTAEITGAKTILRVHQSSRVLLWEPFSIRTEGNFNITRNLYQNRFSNKIIFEENNHDLKLTFQYEWNTSNTYGFVRQSRLINHSKETFDIELLDGLQNIMPHGVPSDLQTRTSNLANAYKRSELIEETGLGIFALSAIIVDKAEPSEALKANVAWCIGLENSTFLLSTLQLHDFRIGKATTQENDIKGEKGAYFVSTKLQLKQDQVKQWLFAGDVNQSQAAVVKLNEKLKTEKDFYAKILDDVQLGSERLEALTTAADGLQYTKDDLKDTRHLSNVLFNIMRGGIFDNNYQIEKWDFNNYLKGANKRVYDYAQPHLTKCGEIFSLFDIKKIAEQSGDRDFIRITTEYLPLKFSRRHGDPSRPWNNFNINTQNDDGSKILDYEGNWRDLFQNWEALAHSYPAFIEGMIFKFLNASTFDGYNPYRVTRGGFDWETIEPGNPWSYIGYWGDHQIIYLLKFLEFAEQYQPGVIASGLNRNDFVYAHVPYRIKPYADIVRNPKDTIEFDHHSEQTIRERMHSMGADGALLPNSKGEVHHVTFIEKILATTLSKLSNFIPEGGIWMNTQRPEWNDANNALVGNGVSMVTLCYLRRFLKFLQNIIQNTTQRDFTVSVELHAFFIEMSEVFERYARTLSANISDETRKQIVDSLGRSGSNYRIQIYDQSFSGTKKNIAFSELSKFIEVSLDFLEHSIKANQRHDSLYHSYNLLSYETNEIKISRLSEMLEGQVAVLSSGFLTPEESLKVLDELRNSSLYRKDQNSYILYPNKSLPKFLEKNNISKGAFESSQLLKKLMEDGDTSIIERDVRGNYHFNGNFNNAGVLTKALNNLPAKYQTLVSKEKELVLSIFEEVFNHKGFTGRSGTFYGYEGLGSIYWHMVSKLLLAVGETSLKSVNQNPKSELSTALVAHYREIFEGIGIHKSPELYGAFPITPYSHTPINKGAQQPGMTGQVKEDIISRFDELGVVITDGRITFQPTMLSKNEFLSEPKDVEWTDVYARKQKQKLGANTLAFTYCQVLIVYGLSDSQKIEVVKSDGSRSVTAGFTLNDLDSRAVFHRTGAIKQVNVFLNKLV